MSTIPRSPGTYILTHRPTGRFYIGSSTNLYSRINHHNYLFRYNKHFSQRLQDVCNSADEIDVEVFPLITRDSAYDLEQELLDKNINNPLCCNVGSDARTIWKDGMPSWRRKRHSEKMQGHGVPEHVRLAVSRANAGKKLGPETLQRMRDAKLGKSNLRVKVMIDGILYSTKKEAMDELRVCNVTLNNRLSSTHPKWESWKVI